MKVILLADVHKLGRKGDIIEVRDGYARNYLIARRLAVSGNDVSASKILEDTRRSEETKTGENKDKNLILKKLKGRSFDFYKKASATGSLYATVSRQDIAKKISENIKQILSADNILTERPIKEIGKHKAYFKSGSERAEFNVIVHQLKPDRNEKK